MKQNQPATDVAAIRRAYGQFLSKGRVPRGIVPDFIERSWQRSAAFGVAYDHIREIGRVDETALRVVVSRHDSLINLATPVMVLSSSPGAWCNASMDTSTAPGYRGYRVPVEIISHCVWLHLRSSIISWTSRKLRQKRKCNQTQWEMISTGTRYPR